MPVVATQQATSAPGRAATASTNTATTTTTATATSTPSTASASGVPPGSSSSSGPAARGATSLPSLSALSHLVSIADIHAALGDIKAREDVLCQEALHTARKAQGLLWQQPLAQGGAGTRLRAGPT